MAAYKYPGYHARRIAVGIGYVEVHRACAVVAFQGDEHPAGKGREVAVVLYAGREVYLLSVYGHPYEAVAAHDGKVASLGDGGGKDVLHDKAPSLACGRKAGD